jgi:hypothetical protein
MGKEVGRIATNLFEKSAMEAIESNPIRNPCRPRRSIRLPQGPLDLNEPIPIDMIGRQPCKLDLSSNELSAKMFAALLEPIGINQPRSVVVRVVKDRSNQSVAVRHGSER